MAVFFTVQYLILGHQSEIQCGLWELKDQTSHRRANIRTYVPWTKSTHKTMLTVNYSSRMGPVRMTGQEMTLIIETPMFLWGASTFQKAKQEAHLKHQ